MRLYCLIFSLGILLPGKTLLANENTERHLLNRLLFDDFAVEIFEGEQSLVNDEGFDIDYGVRPEVGGISYSFNNPLCCGDGLVMRNRISTDLYHNDRFDSENDGYFGLTLRGTSFETMLLKHKLLAPDVSFGYGVGLGYVYTKAETFNDIKRFHGGQITLSLMLQTGGSTFELYAMQRVTEKDTLDERETRINTTFLGIRFGFGTHYLN